MKYITTIILFILVAQMAIGLFEYAVHDDKEFYIGWPGNFSIGFTMK